jgi:gliding motility-associated-like protein
MNYKNASVQPGPPFFGYPVLRILLTGFFLILAGLSLQGMAAPRHGGNGMFGNTIYPVKDFALGNGSAQDIVGVQMSPVPAPPVEITFVINGGVGGYVVIKTDPLTGIATLPLSSPIATTIPVMAEIVDPVTSAVTVIGTITVTFVATPGPPDPSHSYITVVSSPATADGVATDAVQAYVADLGGNPLNSGTVQFNIISGTGNLVGTGTATIVKGFAVMYLNSTVVGNVQVQAIAPGPLVLTANDGTGNKYVTVAFVVGPPDPAKSILTVITSPATADGVATDEVQVQLFDAQGRVVTAPSDVTFSILSGTGNLVGPATITVTGGVGVMYLNSLVVGDVQVQALDVTSGGLISNGSGGNSVTVSFVVGPPDPAQSYITVIQSPQPADGVSTDIVQVFLFDAQGRALTVPKGVVFSILGGTASFASASSVTAIGGVTPAVTLVSSVVGNVTVQAVTADGLILVSNDGTGNKYATVAFVVGPPVPSNPSNPTPPAGGPPTGGSPGSPPIDPTDPTSPGAGFTYLWISYDYVSADGVTADSATAYITDAQGRPLDGIPVTFTFHTGGPANSGALFQPGNVTTIKVKTINGYATVPITGTVPGDVWVDASFSPPDVIAGSTTIAHFTETPDVNNPLTALSVVVYENIADGSGTTVVKAHVVDKSGTIMVGQEVIFAIDSGTATIITPGPWVTDGNGDAFISLTSTKTGFVLITATVDGKAIIFGSPARVKFVPINIYVPKVFTPNNDGTNDVLKPILVGIATFHYFNVYNRWGNLVYASQDPTQGWDGTFRGVAQPVETYLWIAEGIDIQGKKIVQKGMTSLVR